MIDGKIQERRHARPRVPSPDQLERDGSDKPQKATSPLKVTRCRRCRHRKIQTLKPREEIRAGDCALNQEFLHLVTNGGNGEHKMLTQYNAYYVLI